MSQVLAAPAIAGVLLAPNPKLSYGLVALAYVTAETWLGPAAAIVQVLSSVNYYFRCFSMHIFDIWINDKVWILVLLSNDTLYHNNIMSD